MTSHVGWRLTRVLLHADSPGRPSVLSPDESDIKKYSKIIIEVFSQPLVNILKLEDPKFDNTYDFSPKSNKYI